MRWLLVVLIGGALAGCVSTAYVLSIGGRSTHAEKEPVGFEKDISLEMKDAPLAVGGHGLASVGPGKADWVETVTLNVDQIKWSKPGDNPAPSYKKGEVELTIRGIPTQFEVRKYGDKMVLEHTYRHWYGYPAQVLLIVAVPLDAVILVVALPVGAVYSMFAD